MKLILIAISTLFSTMAFPSSDPELRVQQEIIEDAERHFPQRDFNCIGEWMVKEYNIRGISLTELRGSRDVWHEAVDDCEKKNSGGTSQISSVSTIIWTTLIMFVLNAVC